jgi:hypothetical protein
MTPFVDIHIRNSGVSTDRGQAQDAKWALVGKRPTSPTEPAGVLYGPTPLCEPFRPAFEAPQSGAVLREASTLEELACGFVERSDD